MTEKKQAPVEPTQYDTGLAGTDMGIPVLSIVHNQSDIFAAGLAKFGDIVVGANSKDPETQVVYSPHGGDDAYLNNPLAVYIVAPVEKWYAMPYGKGDDTYDFDGTPRVMWTGETSRSPMPREAQINYRYTLLVPSYSSEMPVHWYVKGSAVRALVPLVNRVVSSAKKGIGPFALAFTITTKKVEGQKGAFYVPVIAAAEPDSAAVETGATFYAQLSAPKQAALPAPVDSDAAELPAV